MRFSGPISGVSDADLASLISSTDAKEKEKKKEKGEKKGEKEETLRSPAIFSKATNTVILGWSLPFFHTFAFAFPFHSAINLFRFLFHLFSFDSVSVSLSFFSPSKSCS